MKLDVITTAFAATLIQLSFVTTSPFEGWEQTRYNLSFGPAAAFNAPSVQSLRFY